jgi:hypothetical protein
MLGNDRWRTLTLSIDIKNKHRLSSLINRIDRDLIKTAQEIHVVFKYWC